MTLNEQQSREMQQNQAWLATLATPAPGDATLERVKAVVHACLRSDAAAAHEAVSKAKLAVRREVGARQSARRLPLRRSHAVAILSAAAAVVFAFLGVRGISEPDAAVPLAEFDPFTSTAMNMPDSIDLELIELRMELDQVQSEYFLSTSTDVDRFWNLSDEAPDDDDRWSIDG